MSTTADCLREAVRPLDGSSGQYDALLERVGDARYVLLGEASHGTHEFYRERASITKRLIAELGFRAVAIEGDWPDAYVVNSYVRGAGRSADSIDALRGFRRFPQWMWRNADVLDFIGWLRDHNDSLRQDDRKCGFYGLDLYSLHASMEAVLAYLDRVDPASAARARLHYACFDHFEGNTQLYGWLVGAGASPSCEREVLLELVALRQRAREYLDRDGHSADDAHFCAEQNALVVRDAEEYYRTMFLTARSSWNQRDTHMAQSLGAIADHLERRRSPARIVVWAHNSHVGDARATDMARRGEWNLGQILREQRPEKVVSIGFTTHTGTVTAASEWDAPAERVAVRPSLAGSYERLFHKTGIPRFWLDFRQRPSLADQLRPPALERAIGVIYRPSTERASHYFTASLPEQFDAVIHLDHTRAVEPLERIGEWRAGEVEETYPTGI